MFSRPDVQDEVSRLNAIKSTKMNFKLGLSQTKIRFNQRQDKYKEIMKENQRVLAKLTDSVAAVPSED